MRLGLFQLADKKRVRNRIKEISRILTEARSENMVRMQNISDDINRSNRRLQESFTSLSLIKNKIEKSLAWREKAVRIYPEDYNSWFRYEYYLLPIPEYLEQHDRVTVNEIYENHPHKDDFQSRTIVSYLRNEPSKQFFREEKPGDGRYYFSLVR